MMDELMKDMGSEGGGGKSPRLMALEKLLDFIAQSETNRAAPPVEPAPAVEEPGLDDGTLAGLAGLKDEDEDGV